MRRRVRSTPLVTQLEGRALLSAVAHAHQAEVRSVPAVPVQVHIEGVHSRPNHNLSNLKIQSGGKGRSISALSQLEARMASLSAQRADIGLISNDRNPMVVMPNLVAGPSPSSTSSIASGMVVPDATNPGGGPNLSGSLNNFDEGSAFPGSAPGLGPKLTGSLMGPDEGTAFPGSAPGTGLDPSGTI
jgi:hypothetical protein